MSQRKCAYTGLPAKTTDKVIPTKDGGDQSHNWANSVPCSNEYKKIKAMRQPNQTELEAANLFFEIESAKLKLQSLEQKRDVLQAKLREKHNIEYYEEVLEDKKPPKPKKLSKDEQTKQAYKEKELIEMDAGLDKVVEKKKKETKAIF